MRHASAEVATEALRLLRPFWPLAAFSTTVGGLSGLASAGLLAAINQALHDEPASFAVLAAVAGLCLVSLAGEFFGNLGSSLFGQRIVAALRKELAGKILRAPIAEIERYKPHRLMAILVQDVNTIASFTLNCSAIAVAFAVAVGCFVYLAVLSLHVFVVALTAVVVVSAIQTAASRTGARRFNLARDAHDDLQKHYGAIIDGAKELRVSRQRRVQVLGRLTATVEDIRDQFVRATRIFFAARVFDSAFFYTAIFLVLALGTRASVDKTVVSGFIVGLFYVRGPLEQVIAALPFFGEAQVSFLKISEMSAAFANPEPRLPLDNRPTQRFAGERIELRNVQYAFAAPEGGAPFVLGPATLCVKRGELLFIVGKNGCGKSTLLKLLLGLYTPDEGELLCDGTPVGPDERDDYRQLFSTVFFDYYLFEDLLAADEVVPADVDRCLQTLEIAGKVTVRDGRFSTTDLSSGQRKRLALVHVLLERRPLVVLDEWAADQDPTFRRIFYEELLPGMRRQGKTIILVSHDDRYFGAADRLIRLDAGKIVEDTRPHQTDTSRSGGRVPDDAGGRSTGTDPTSCS